MLVYLFLEGLARADRMNVLNWALVQRSGMPWIRTIRSSCPLMCFSEDEVIRAFGLSEEEMLRVSADWDTSAAVEDGPSGLLVVDTIGALAVLSNAPLETKDEGEMGSRHTDFMNCKGLSRIDDLKQELSVADHSMVACSSSSMRKGSYRSLNHSSFLCALKKASLKFSM